MYSAIQVFRQFSLPLHTVDHYSTIILQFCSCRPCTTYPRGGDYAFYLIASLCLSSSQNNYFKKTWLQTQIELFEEIKNKKIKNTRGIYLSYILQHLLALNTVFCSKPIFPCMFILFLILNLIICNNSSRTDWKLFKLDTYKTLLQHS